MWQFSVMITKQGKQIHFEMKKMEVKLELLCVRATHNGLMWSRQPQTSSDPPALEQFSSTKT